VVTDFMDILYNILFKILDYLQQSKRKRYNNRNLSNPKFKSKIKSNLIGKI